MFLIALNITIVQSIKRSVYSIVKLNVLVELIKKEMKILGN